MDAEQFVREFLAGEFEELELPFDVYSELASFVPDDRWIPEGPDGFWLVSGGRRFLYERGMSEDESTVVRLVLVREEVTEDGKSETQER